MESTPEPAKQSMRAPLALPYDVVVDIVCLVAATSPHPFADLRSIGATCKAMYDVTKEPEVLRCVVLEKENLEKWFDNNHFPILLKNLVGAGNPDACFLFGLMQVFTHEAMQSGLALLEKAAATGHKTAAYVLGVVLCSANDTREVAKRYIAQVEADSDSIISRVTKITNLECGRCRQRVIGLMIWMKIGSAPNQVLLDPYGRMCAREGCGMLNLQAENNNVFCSHDCRITYEYIMFKVCRKFLVDSMMVLAPNVLLGQSWLDI